MAKILITGATGFLGSSVLKNLLNKNHELIVLTRSSSSTCRIDNLEKTYRSYNLDKFSIREIFKKETPEIIIHTACSYGRYESSITTLLESNLLFGLEILDAAIEYNAKILINTDTLLPKNLSDYSLSKWQFRDWLNLKSSQIPVVNIKIEHMYGPLDSDSKFVGWLLKQMTIKSSKPINLTSGIQKRDFIFIDDAVSAFSLVVDRFEIFKNMTEFHLGTGVFLSVKDFVINIATELEERSRFKVLNRLNFGEISYRSNEQMIPDLDNTSLKLLGWLPIISVDNGIAIIVDEHLSNLDEHENL